MVPAADAASALLKALANRHRLVIICQLIEKERSVGELAELLDIRDSTVSQHLALLRRDGLVSARRDGQTVWYSIGSAPARDLVAVLYRSYCAAGIARKPAAKSAPKPLRGNAPRTGAPRRVRRLRDINDRTAASAE
jgi:DNA-binding transcriptional ArsR family regulator